MKSLTADSLEGTWGERDRLQGNYFEGFRVDHETSGLLTLGALSAGAVILLAGCSSGAADPATSTPSTTASAQPTSVSVDHEAARLAAEQSAESSRLVQEAAARAAAERKTARLAAEEAARIDTERLAAEQAAAEETAAEKASAEEAAAEQAAAEEGARHAAEEQARFDAAVEAGSCVDAPAGRVGECITDVEIQGAAAAAEKRVVSLARLGVARDRRARAGRRHPAGWRRAGLPALRNHLRRGSHVG